MSMTYGYARDRNQTGLARQVADLVAAGLPDGRVFRDLGGPSSAEGRPGLDSLLAALRPNDVVLTYAPNRLVGGISRVEDLVASLERVGAIARTLDGEPIGGKVDELRAQTAAAETPLDRDLHPHLPATPGL
jgi:DNA invertase Pin-like site-specific DNA recombinase